jgi:hypothetical protein
MSKVKTIIVNGTLTGKGCPNKEGKDGAFMWNAWASSQKKAASEDETVAVQFAKSENDNYTFAKANYYKDEKTGKIERRVKISGDCLRHNIFGSTNSAAIKEDASTLIAYTASAEGILRGYLATVKGSTTAKNKSKFTMTDAELSNGAISQLETHSSSGARTNTSLFSKESLGDTEFKFTAHIDVSELGVLSCCDTFDRPCVQEEFQQLYEKKLSENGIDFKKVALRKKSDVQAEICYKLDDKSVNYLVNLLLYKISQLHFGNATEFVQFSEFADGGVIFVNEDGTRETVKFTDGHLEKDFEVASQYVEADYDEALAAERRTRKLVEETKNKGTDDKKVKKGKKAKAETTEEK